MAVVGGWSWKRSRGADRGAELVAARRMELSAVLKQERNEAVLSESSAALALFTLLLKLYDQTKLIDWQPTVGPTVEDLDHSRKSHRYVISTAQK